MLLFVTVVVVRENNGILHQTAESSSRYGRFDATVTLRAEAKRESGTILRRALAHPAGVAANRHFALFVSALKGKGARSDARCWRLSMRMR
jgi:hypothetical protein